MIIFYEQLSANKFENGTDGMDNQKNKDYILLTETDTEQECEY